MRYPLLYCLLAFFCISCSKGGTAAVDEVHAIDTSDTTYPVVEVTAPTDNQSFTSGSVINVTGKVSDNSLLGGSITIRNGAGQIVKDQYYEIHFIPSYDFSMSCTISVTAAADFTVTVQFEDHGFNKTTKTLKITVNP